MITVKAHKLLDGQPFCQFEQRFNSQNRAEVSELVERLSNEGWIVSYEYNNPKVVDRIEENVMEAISKTYGNSVLN